MKQVVTVITVAAVFGSVLFVHDQYRLADRDKRIAEAKALRGRAISKTALRAAGRIEGSTEVIELRARISEPIAQIHVTSGQWVNAGTVLVSLESNQLAAERDLADAMLNIEQARKLRLVNGARSSEIEVARQEYQSAVAKLAGADKAYVRSLKLAESNAISSQEIDDYEANLHSLRALAAAAQGKFETLRLPVREDELQAAEAAVRAAAARLQIAQINLDRAKIIAPVEGKVLTIEGELGEQVGPNSQEPLVVMADTRSLTAVAEVDEFDALRVYLGQTCAIECDAKSGIVARGHVTRIEPQMLRKRIVGQWAGERSDTFSRRVWIRLESTDSATELPVGLPVDVYIDGPGAPSE